MPASAQLLSGQVILEDEVESSPLDLRKFRALTLSNKLKVLLVSDCESDTAAASLTVGVGSFSDPDDLPGLAHFLEHMLFLGTEKYPEEDSYNTFISQNGGHSNAMTMGERTNYHFDMCVADRDPDHPAPRFREALDRFSQFFTAPLFTDSATDRELNAVDSEHQKNLQSDANRLNQLKKSCSNPEHPISKFSTGSKTTLFDIPRSSNVDTRAQLLKFYRRYYSSNLMNLCISAPYPLDLLQGWVVELFSDIPNYNCELPCEQYRSIKPLLPEHTGLIYHFKTICDFRLLEISWNLPTYIHDYFSRPAFIVAEVLADEGKGSLLSFLREKGWCEGLHVCPSDTMTFGMMQMHVELTENGINFVDEIISIIFQYIRLVRKNGIPERIFKEEVALADLNFRFKEREEPVTFSTDTSLQMHHYEPRHYLTGQALVKTYEPEKIRQVLDLLTAEDCIIIIGSKVPSVPLDKKEQWYGTEYAVECIDSERMGLWTSGNAHSTLDLPLPNPFIPTDFTLLAEHDPSGKHDWKGPNLIQSNELFDLYHKLDRTYRLPHTQVTIMFWSAYAYISPYHSVLTSILKFLLEDSLKEFLYPAEKAGFAYNLVKTQSGFELNAQGYSHRIGVLLAAIFDKIGSFTSTESEFEIQKDRVMRTYLNFKMDQPFQRAVYYRNLTLESSRWHVDQYVECINRGEVTLSALNTFARDVFKRMWASVVFHGNISEESAKELMASVHTKLEYSPISVSEMPLLRAVELPKGQEVFIRKRHSNPDDNNSAIDVFYQMFPRGDPGRDACLELLSEILNKPAFHELRTVQQLGYMVFQGVQSTEGFSGMFFIIQSTVADPDTLLDRIEQFLRDARTTVLEDMVDETMQDYVKALIAGKAEPEQTLGARTRRFVSEINTGLLKFDRYQKEIEALKSLKKKDVLDMFDKYIGENSESVRKIVSQIYGNQHAFEKRRELRQGAWEVTDHLDFRRRRPLYPCVGIPGSRGVK